MDAQGQALDISDLYQQWEREGVFNDMVPWAHEKWDYNGKRPGVTWQFDQRAIFYRKDLFQQAGIKPPTTWDELLAAAKKLHDPSKGMIGIAVPGKQGSYDTDQFYMTLSSRQVVASPTKMATRPSILQNSSRHWSSKSNL